MSAPFPPPNATAAEVAAWKREHDSAEARALCDCGDMRARHDGSGCLVEGCDCEGFDDAPHEAPRVSNGPSLVCNACQKVRVGLSTPFCKGCLAMIGPAVLR